jgi:hypothetical protein
MNKLLRGITELHPLGVATVFALVITPAVVVWVTGYEPPSARWGRESSGGTSVHDKEIPSARVSHGQDGAHVLACQSVEQYRQLAPIFMLGNGPPIVRAINAKQCVQINDRAEYAWGVQPHHHYRVASIEAGLACVWALDSPGGCYWTRADNLQHIGRGPQLSENQFRDVRMLYAQLQDLRELRSDYDHQAIRIKDRQGDRREEARLRALAKQAEDQALAIEDRIAQFQPTEPPPTESNVAEPKTREINGWKFKDGWGDE